MKKALFFSIFMTGCLMINGQTGEKNFIDQNYIEVTGKLKWRSHLILFISKY